MLKARLAMVLIIMRVSLIMPLFSFMYLSCSCKALVVGPLFLRLTLFISLYFPTQNILLSLSLSICWLKNIRFRLIRTIIMRIYSHPFYTINVINRILLWSAKETDLQVYGSVTGSRYPLRRRNKGSRNKKNFF